MSIEETLGAIERICHKKSVEHLLLFGSFAKGTQTPTSDIDIVVKGDFDFDALEDELDDILTLRKIDVIHYDTCRNKHLKEAIDQYAREIY